MLWGDGHFWPAPNGIQTPRLGASGPRNDHDGPGRKHAAAVSAALLNVAASIRIVEGPGLTAKGDVTDWRNAGGTGEQFQELVELAPVVDAAALTGLRMRWGLANEELHQLH